MTYSQMLPPPRAAPERYQVGRARSGLDLPAYQEPVASPPPGSSIAPVALSSLVLPQPHSRTQRPARLPGTVALAVLAAAAAFAIGGLALVVVDHGQAGATAPALAQGFTPADPAAALLAVPADARLAERSSPATGPDSGVTELPMPETAATVLAGGKGRVAALIVLPEVILRPEPVPH